MSASFLARLMVTAVAAGQGITPLFIDLNRTHATNPLWPGHARFHVVWQTMGFFFLGVIGVTLIWLPSPESRLLFYLAALLTASPMLSFLVAMFSLRAYDGTLHDPNGIQPVRIRIGTTVREFDMNAVLVIVGMAIVLSAVLVF
jgi:hypothetical protein